MTMKQLMMLLAICLLGLEAQQVFAQSDPLEPGRQAFREGRYEDAAEDLWASSSGESAAG